MALDDEYSDDFVANALKQDARASSIKYSTLGLEAYLPKRSTAAAPKPNTRFLRNILRETDSHNAALLAKEKREARERERALNRRVSSRHSHFSHSDQRESRHHSPGARDEHRPYHGSGKGEGRSNRDRAHKARRSSRSRSPERRGKDSDSLHKQRKRRRRRSPSSDRASDADRSRKTRGERHENRKSRHESRRNHHHSQSRHTGSPSRSTSGVQGEQPHSKDRKPRHRRSSNRSRDSTPPQSTDGNAKSRKSATKRRFLDDTATPRSSDSDPLETIIGPPPPPPEPEVKSKGRGAFRGSGSAMDSHFSSDYNPKVDVNVDSESEDDWEQALEALKDRQRWKQQGADRLRAAGFSDSDIKKWEKGAEKDESDVRWAKKGEGREWDRGKVVGSDGGVDLKPTWS